MSAEVPAAARGTNEPGAYLDANVYTLCIQDVEDPWGEPVTFVSGQPALADKVVHDALGGHDDGELLQQPAALRGSTIVPHLWGTQRKHLLRKGEHLCMRGIHLARKGSESVYAITAKHSSREWRELSNSGWGSSDHQLLCRREAQSLKPPRGRLDWCTWKPVQSHVTLLLGHCPLYAHLQFAAGTFLHLDKPFPLLSLHLEGIIQIFTARRKDAAQQTPTCIITSASLTNPLISELNVWGCSSASHPFQTAKALSLYRRQQMELASVAGWFSRTTSSSLKNDLSWRPGSDTRVATSLHRGTSSSWKNLSGKRKNIREMAAGAEAQQRQCTSVQGWVYGSQSPPGTESDRNQGISPAKQCWRCKFLQEPTCVPLKEGWKFSLGQTWKQNYVSRLIYEPWSVIPMSCLSIKDLTALHYLQTMCSFCHFQENEVLSPKTSLVFVFKLLGYLGRLGKQFLITDSSSVMYLWYLFFFPKNKWSFLSDSLSHHCY